MKHVRILLHAGLALLPTLLARELLRLAPLIADAFAYNCAAVVLFLFTIGATAFLPLFVATAARNARYARGDPGRIGTPVHPIGWITLFGVFGHVPAVWIASQLSGDVYPVSFSFLGPPLIAASVVLSWRYVHKTWSAPLPPSEDEF